jgi:hypothetical protein
MRTLTAKLTATSALVLALLLILAGSIALANILPSVWGLLVIPAQVFAGYCISDTVAQVWNLDGQYDDGE